MAVTRIRLVRHAEPAEVIGVDPELTALGFEQAAALVHVLDPSALVTSPLRRARSTAAPLAAAWGYDPVVVDAVREMPSPSSEIDERRAWLRSALGLSYAELGDEQHRWRAGILDHLRTYTTDTVVVTHTLVINAVVGVCTGDDRVLNMRPAHASVTTVDVHADGTFVLVERGEEARSIIT